MNSIDPAQELKTLQKFNKFFTDEAHELKKQGVIRKAIYLMAMVALVLAFLIGLNGGWVNLLAVAIAGVAGMFSGFTIYWNLAAKQWPLVKPHVNQESIKERIQQLQT